MVSKSSLNKLSIIIPAFNEESSIEKILGEVLNSNSLSLAKEIIVVDDYSSDNTIEIAKNISSNHECIKIIAHSKNCGKGAALRTGFSIATGEIVLIQDADLEYSPREYPKLLEPIVDGKADVVYGSRFRSEQETRVLYFWHRIANGLLTLMSNMFTNLNLTDMETCYKVFRKEILDQIELVENRFGVEPELTAKISRIPNIRIYEVGISYFGRTYAEGKKIGLKDAFRAFYAILKYGLFR
jgi:glycosyltransferase involved in cell wall biosynthesis